MTVSDGDKAYNSVDEMFSDMDREFRKKHPIKQRINDLFGGTLFGYAPHYALTHPLDLLGDAIRHIVWAWQRVFRGFDDRAIWGIDFYLARMIPQYMDLLKENISGISFDYFDRIDLEEGGVWRDYTDEEHEAAKNKFMEVIEQVADGFRAYIRIDEEMLFPGEPKYIEEKEKFDKGFQLFIKHFHTFGD